MQTSTRKAFGTGGSLVVTDCQICGSSPLDPILFLGYLPPVNSMPPIGEIPHEQSSYPAQLLYCPHCHLVQLGCIVDPEIIFPSSYPYTSSTTKILRDNFAELYQECKALFKFDKKDLVVDIGSNDGNLLSNFKDHHRVLGITPEEIGKLAIARGIPTIINYFSREIITQVLNEYGRVRIITATNVFAHIECVNETLDAIIDLLDDTGVFISESHYLLPLIEDLQYDTIYHEHLRYYSLHSLKYLFEDHGLELIHAKRIPTHGGSIRVYAARPGCYPVQKTVSRLLKEEENAVIKKSNLLQFRDKVVLSKLKLQALILEAKKNNKRIFGISAPSRASTLINYVGIDDGILDCVVEIKGSHKIGRYIPGTMIPVLDESKLYRDQPEYALLLSWHIADELAPKLKKLGYEGDFIIPLPEPRILKNANI